MNFRTDRQRVHGLGSAKGGGTDHFWHQRLTAIALIPLFIFFVFPFARNLGADYETVIAAYSNPFNAIIAILFILVGFQHLKMGLQVIIEDYVHDKVLFMLAMIANILLTWAFSLAGAYAVIRIALSA